MKQNQDKREAFRQQIRRKQISDMFKRVRQENRERSVNGFQNFDPAHVKEISEVVSGFMQKCLENYCNRNHEEILKQILLVKQKVQVNSEIFSFVINEYLRSSGEKFVDLVKKDVTKQSIQSIPQQRNLQIQIEEQSTESINIKIVQELMSLSANIFYEKFCLQSLVLILKFIWNSICGQYYKAKTQIEEEKKVSTQIFTNICISLNRIMSGAHHQVMREQLKSLGFCSHLQKMINISPKFDNNFHINLSKLVKLYNTNPVFLEPEDIVNGVSIISVENEHKAKYVLYSIHLLNRNCDQLYESSLLILNNIFEEYTYLIDSTKVSFYAKVLNLLLHQNRRINVAAIQLLSTLAFYSLATCDQMVEKNGILDFIQRRLVLERDSPIDQYTKQSIQKCTNILCDLLMTKCSKLKKFMFGHHIWSLIYESMREGDKLFPTVVCFKFFFSAFGRKQRFQILPSFLQAVSVLPLQNELIPEIKELKETLMNIFYSSEEFDDEEEHQEIKDVFEKYGLLNYVNMAGIQLLKN